MLSRCFGDSFLGNIPTTTGFLYRKSKFGLAFGVEENQLELLVWPKTTWVGQTKGPKLVTYMLWCFNRSLLACFSTTAGFFGGLAGYGLTKGCARYNLGIQTWSIIVLVGRQQAPKSASFTYFLLQSGTSRQDLGDISLPQRRISVGLC